MHIHQRDAKFGAAAADLTGPQLLSRNSVPAPVQLVQGDYCNVIHCSAPGSQTGDDDDNDDDDDEDDDDGSGGGGSERPVAETEDKAPPIAQTAAVSAFADSRKLCKKLEARGGRPDACGASGPPLRLPTLSPRDTGPAVSGKPSFPAAESAAASAAGGNGDASGAGKSGGGGGGVSKSPSWRLLQAPEPGGGPHARGHRHSSPEPPPGVVDAVLAGAGSAACLAPPPPPARPAASPTSCAGPATALHRLARLLNQRPASAAPQVQLPQHDPHHEQQRRLSWER
ncbi:uncharacterized protein LOC126336092 [Schistocerca gregaria]|uniref:uncharacterized protein LOC126336092 n=1 Tax=Schistocerca gregaria TaxID=7010 RepID=UPI00211F0EB8|nr:uncharacterized protein LOC126336092 [Schistocerca gregaria]